MDMEALALQRLVRLVALSRNPEPRRFGQRRGLQLVSSETILDCNDSCRESYRFLLLRIERVGKTHDASRCVTVYQNSIETCFEKTGMFKIAVTRHSQVQPLRGPAV